MPRWQMNGWPSKGLSMGNKPQLHMPLMQGKALFKEYGLAKATALAKQSELSHAATSVLAGVDFELMRGQTVALCGPSGSGKSTLLNICGLLDKQYQGKVYWHQSNTANLSTKELSAKALTEIRRQHLGFIFQHFNLVPVLSARENIEYPLHLLGMSAAERRVRVQHIVDRVGLTDVVEQKPDQLSGGQQQRVAIARALVKRPALVIADEPTANLDATTALQVMALVQEMAAENNTAFLIATHDNRISQFCDRLWTMENGLIVEGQPSSHSQPDLGLKRPEILASQAIGGQNALV